ARATAEAFGMPDYPIAVVERTLTNLDPTSILALTDAVIEEVLAALTSGAAGSGGTGISIDCSASFNYTGADLLAAAEGFQDDFLRRGWGDGFPLCLPTPKRVQAMLRGTRHAADEVVVTMWPGMTVATVEKIAVNAVMAGCRPEHLPVLLAAVQAMNEPEY